MNSQKRISFIKVADEFDRANWLAEFCTEWFIDQKQPIPIMFLKNMSPKHYFLTNLTTNGATAVDALISAVKRAN